METLAQTPANSSTNDKDQMVMLVAKAVVTMQQQMSTMETFIRRRFDEISMEINATSQQIDMNEQDMSHRFGEILGVMNAISYNGDGDTPANTGVELEAVVAETTKAATQILDSTDKMSSILYEAHPDDWIEEETREALLSSLRDHVQNIMLSCSFQDITSQRIRKTLESINDIEDRISETLETLGIDVPAHPEKETNEHIVHGNSQADIDALFS